MPNSVHELESYEAHVEDALTWWLTSNRTRNILVELASLLGCPHMGLTRVGMPMPLPDEQTESIVYRAWLRVLEAYDSTNVKAWAVERHLVAGLLQNNRWRLLLTSEQGARRWTALMTRYLEHGGPEKMVLSDHDIEMGRLVHAELEATLATWLGVAYREGAPRDLTMALFGDAWCTMVFDCRPPGENLADMIDLTEPSFARGVLATGVATPALSLPDIA